MSAEAFEDHFRIFATECVDLLCIAGTDGYFKWLNPQWTRVLGHSEETLLATPFIEFVHTDDREATTNEVTRVGEGATALNFQNRFRCKDGTFL